MVNTVRLSASGLPRLAIFSRHSLIDGRGHRFSPWSTDPSQLAAYTLGEQLTTSYRFATSLRVARSSQPPVLVTAALAEKAANLRYDDLSAEARTVVGHCFMDFFGVTLAARNEPLAATASRIEHWLLVEYPGYWPYDPLAASIFAGRLGGGQDLQEVAAAARAAPVSPGPPRAIDLLLDGLATRYTEGYAAGLAPLRRALDAFARDHSPGDQGLRWLLMAWPASHEVWDDESWDRLTMRAVTLARDAGALTVLPIFLLYRAAVDIYAGEFAAAAVLSAEADAIVEATGNTRWQGTSLLLAAWRGQEDATLSMAGASIQAATARGEGRAICMAELSRAVLYNGLGRYEDALAAAQRACEHEDFGMFGWPLTELIEAAVRSGQLEVATSALRLLEERTGAAGTDWALGIQARSRALVGDSEDADTLYREAIERLARTRIVVHRARAQLLYGEWLRRENRRLDARKQLHAAHDMFGRMGAEAFAERARRELLATGETIRKRTAETLYELTAQEAQVARLAVDGCTNPEIGTQLFISPRTVEYHLRKVFTKLDIRSRKELRGALRYASHAGAPA
jgi:DNA-binding CsgD family transcriptional regulator